MSMSFYVHQYELKQFLAETEEICERTCINILHLIQSVAMHPQGYEHVCISLEQVDVDNVMYFFNLIGHMNSGNNKFICTNLCRVLHLKIP